MGKVFCINCNEETDYITKEVTKEYNVKGVKIEENIKETFCKQCGEKVFIYAIEKENQQKVYDAYKKKMGLLTSKEIIAIRQKYGLSQRKLASLIQCGEKNIARYENCAIQDKSIDLLIAMVDKYPEIFGLTVKKPLSEDGWIVLSHTNYYEENTINTKIRAKHGTLRRVGCNA